MCVSRVWNPQPLSLLQRITNAPFIITLVHLLNSSLIWWTLGGTRLQIAVMIPQYITEAAERKLKHNLSHPTAPIHICHAGLFCSEHFQLFLLRLNSHVFMVVWILHYKAERKSQSRGCACVKNTFVVNGRLAGLCVAENDVRCHGSNISLVSVGTGIQILTDWILSMADFTPGKKKSWRDCKTGRKWQRKTMFPSRSVSDLEKARLVLNAFCFIDAFRMRYASMRCRASVIT